MGWLSPSPISWMCLLWHAQTKFHIGYRSLELVVVELVYDPSLKVKITPNGTRATPRVPILSTDS